MYYQPILIKCVKCEYEDLPENFNAIQRYVKNDPGIPMRVIEIQCPNCDNQLFFTHFAIYSIPEPIDFNSIVVSRGHDTQSEWKKLDITKEIS